MQASQEHEQSENNKEMQQTVNLESQKKISKLIQTMPSIHIKYRIRNSTISATEVAFNENFSKRSDFQ